MLPPAPKTWSPGDVIGGRYRLVSRLGAGGMGAVWRAHHLGLGSDVAIKLLHATIAGDPTAVARFEREARTAAALRSPHVVQILEHGIDEGAPFIVMELLLGESLAQRLARTPILSPEHAAKIVAQVARALGKAHEVGVIHRDLKPENVFLVHDEDDEVAKLLDFGIAKLTEPAMVAAAAAPVTRTDAILGTPLYMSPEQLRGRAVDLRADLWSLAVITFECLCGRSPFRGETLADLILAISTDPIPIPSQGHVVPRGFDEWFLKGVSRDPRGRFGSAREMAEAFGALLGSPVAKPHLVVPRRSRPPGEEARYAEADTMPDSDGFSEDEIAPRLPEIERGTAGDVAVAERIEYASEKGDERQDDRAFEEPAALAPVEPEAERAAADPRSRTAPEGRKRLALAMAIAVLGAAGLIAWTTLRTPTVPAPGDRGASLPTAAAEAPPRAESSRANVVASAAPSAETTAEPASPEPRTVPSVGPASAERPGPPRASSKSATAAGAAPTAAASSSAPANELGF